LKNTYTLLKEYWKLNQIETTGNITVICPQNASGLILKFENLLKLGWVSRLSQVMLPPLP